MKFVLFMTYSDNNFSSMIRVRRDVKLMKKVIFITQFLFCLSAVFSKNIIVKDKIEYPIVIENQVESNHKIIASNGTLFLKSNVVVEDGTIFPFIFILDTGAASSSIILDYNSDNFSINDYFSYKINNSLYLKCSAHFNDFLVEDFFLGSVTASQINLKELKLIFNDKDYCFAILGNDVLMNKSFFLSISKGYFKWQKKNPFNEQDEVFVPQIDKICSSRGNRDFYQYTVYIEDNYFKSDAKDYPILGFFNSPDKTKSRYYIDTGTYYIATSNIDLYYQIKNRGYKNYTYNSEVSQAFGYSNIPNPAFLGKQFESLDVMSGGTPEMFKCLGNQVLSAFDIYFDKENSEKVQKIYFKQVLEAEYKKYRTENDKSYYYPASTFGFRAANNMNRVSEKAFVNGKEILKEIEFGDIILSVNGIPNNFVKEWELPNKIKIEVKKKDGSIKTVHAKRHYIK